MAAKQHAFDGEQLTVAEIMQRVPALGESAIRNALAAGRNTTAAMLSFDPKRATVIGARKAAARARANGHEPKCFRRKAS